MIDNIGGVYILYCDICIEEAPISFEDFYEAVDYKKDHDWKNQRNSDGSWQDVCPECAEKGRNLNWD